MTYYLKYRPQRVDELDLDNVRDQLKKIIAAADKPHAFLFCGPRGSGKTSTARILAKAVNCTSSAEDGEPCNKCDSCTAVTKGSSLDVIEIDAASHRGVDDVRSLRETVKLSPSGSKMKVYIIDEAHMLTTEAANALLKTLEEPPSHAMFILATTALEKLLDTIRSRCTIVNFSKGAMPEIVRALQKAVEGEELKVERGVLESLALHVDGSFREAHKLLEQLALSSKRIKLADVDKISTSFGRSPEELIKLLAAKDVKKCFEEIERLVQEGVNLKAYTTQLISLLRTELLARLGLGEDNNYGLNVSELKKLLELFSNALSGISTSVIPQLPLELAVVEWCVEVVEGSVSTRLLTQEPSLEGERNSKQDLAQTRGSGTRKQSPAYQEGIEDKYELRSQIHGSSQREDEEVVQEDPLNSKLIDEGELEEKWKQILKAAKGKNFAVEALLKAAKPYAFDGKNLQVEIFYRFHKEKLEKDPFRSIIEKTASSVLGTGSVKLVCLLSSSKKRAADVVNVKPADDEISKLAEQIFGGENADMHAN